MTPLVIFFTILISWVGLTVGWATYRYTYRKRDTISFEYYLSTAIGNQIMTFGCLCFASTIILAGMMMTGLL